MIHPCDTPFQQRARKAVLDACEASDALWYANILTPRDFQDQEGHIDLYTDTREIAWEEVMKLQQRLQKSGWKCDVLGIQGARDPIRLINSYPASEEPRFFWEEHLQDGKLILRLRLSELPREEQK